MRPRPAGGRSLSHESMQVVRAGSNMSESRSDGGFTVVELLLTVTIIGILASMAVPALSRAKAVSAEASTVGSLRAIGTAQATFAASCADGYYAPALSWLTEPAAVGRAAFLGQEFSGSTVTRLDYRIRLMAGSAVAKAPASCNGLAKGESVQSYFVGADPLVKSAATGTRHFGASSDNIIYQSTKNISPFYTGVPPSPAKALD